MDKHRTVLASSSHSQLLIIDLQQRLCSAMPEETLNKVIKNAGVLIDAAQQLAIPIITTEQYPQGLGSTHDDLRAKLNDTHPVFSKTCFAGSCLSEVDNYMREQHRQHVILSGIETHICVLQTAMDLLNKGYIVFVAQDACCSRDKNHYQNALQRMREAGAIISNSESILFEWLRDAAHTDFKTLSKLIR